MKISESYVAALWFLQELVDRKLIGVHPPTEDLDVTCILSSMDLGTRLQGGKEIYTPLDQSRGGDWKGAITFIGGNVKGDISSKQAFLGMIAFIEFYKNEFEFDVQETIDLLTAMIANPDHYKELWKLWDHYIDRYTNLLGDYPVDIEGTYGTGHLSDTSINRDLILTTARSGDSYLGRCQNSGHDWYHKILENGQQLWAEVRNGIIINGGQNTLPIKYNPSSGVKKALRARSRFRGVRRIINALLKRVCH
ncbi:hypothetical protein [Candidatus Bodocaedibacter vickermanii]